MLHGIIDTKASFAIFYAQPRKEKKKKEIYFPFSFPATYLKCTKENKKRGKGERK